MKAFRIWDFDQEQQYPDALVRFKITVFVWIIQPAEL
jgi:hypothetical protein